MDVEELIARYPRVYHMAEKDTWPSIRQRGLLSTSAALDLVGINGDQRFAIESCHRPDKIAVGIGANQIVLRDQKPMAPERLKKALQGELRPQEWYEAINGKVFFWVAEDRLLGLLNAREYRNLEHDVLTIDANMLVKAYAPQIWLCHMNSGNTFPFPHPRDLSVFRRIKDYPVNSRGGPKKPVVELLVDGKIPDIAKFVVDVRRMHGPNILRHL